MKAHLNVLRSLRALFNLKRAKRDEKFYSIFPFLSFFPFRMHGNDAWTNLLRFEIRKEPLVRTGVVFYQERLPTNALDP